ncbi:hypothetical protein POTOM_038408 [Populus tomentosa]|uniref:Uncharacterized protein n=1 Tax=Populus tomentosa TaxID=118781 RepID=A0A8X8CL34_POPTO|nr:hypothetical protein POTOM_038408 [Populus tomentosa]
MLRCMFFFKLVEAEFWHFVGVNHLFAPWISWLLLLESGPFVAPNTVSYLVLWWVYAVPIVALDVKIYGQWFSKGKRFLSTFANPTSQLSVIGNLVGAQAAAKMGWKEIAIFLFSPGMVHYLVLFATPFYQRLSDGSVLHGGLNCSFPLTVQAVASRDYAEEVKGGIADALMLLLSGTSRALQML